MNIRRISILLSIVVAGSGPALAQDGADPAADGVPAQSSLVTEPTSAASTEPSPVATDAGGAVTEPATAPTKPSAMAPEPQPAPATAVTESVPPAPSPADDERLRSIFIIVSAVVLIGALSAIIFLLIRRGREAGRQQRQYAAEAYLRDTGGNTSQAMYKLGSKPVMLGRVGGKDTDFLDYIVVPSATVGRRHALIEFKDFGYWIMDQGSINGTFVNGRPVSSEVRLKHGDRIRLHKLEFEFVMPEVSESSVTVLARDADRAGTGAPAPAGFDLVLEPEPDIVSPAPAHNEVDALEPGNEPDEETLLPGASAASPGRTGGSDEETLLPAGGATGAPGSEETLLPAPGSAGRARPARKNEAAGDSGDEFIDITRGS